MAKTHSKAGRNASNDVIRTDVAIVGGGPAGCCLALLLARQGLQVVCIDRDDPEEASTGRYDGRTTAISYGSREIIKKTGIWDSLVQAACPIETIHIKESGSPTLLEFSSNDVDGEAFGWIVGNAALRASLYDAMAKEGITHAAPATVVALETEEQSAAVFLADGRRIEASLVVGADGKNSWVRERMDIGTRGRAYDQKAVVCVVRHENPHHNVAVEDFRSGGPFAILPMTDTADGTHRSSVVWTEHVGGSRVSTWTDDTFDAALSERFPPSYGTVKRAGPLFSYPLSLTHAQDYMADRTALIADAAHAIHPIAGQGLNLGLRDVDTLAKLIMDARSQNSDIGAAQVLQKYAASRRPDVMSMAGATDLLNMLFSNNSAPLKLMRMTGLKAIQKFPSAKRFFMRHAMGISRLARG